MEVMNWNEAATRGLKKYFTGKPCCRGHVTLRYVSSNACVDCISGYGRKYRDGKKAVMRKSHMISVELFSVDDIPALLAYVRALNFEREMESIADGSHFRAMGIPTARSG